MNTNDDSWDSVVCETENLDLYGDIQPHDVLMSVVFVLDATNRLFVEYKTGEWTVPVCLHSTEDTVKDITKDIMNRYSLPIKVQKMVGLKIYKNYDKGVFYTKPTIKYVTLYLTTIEQITTAYDEDSCATLMFTHQHDLSLYHAYLTYSRLIEEPIYRMYKPFIDVIYDPMKLNLLLDVDSTLLVSYQLYGTCLNNNITGDHMVFRHGYYPNHILNMDAMICYVWTRPHMLDFLKKMSDLTHISFWTASTRVYQEKVLQITGILQYAKEIHYNDTCLLTGTTVYKSLEHLNKIIKVPYNLDHTLLIEDNTVNKKYNMDNCLLVSPWDIIHQIDSALMDYELPCLINIIKQITDLVIHDNTSVQKIVRQKTWTA
jgi:hypothetical protein